MLVVPARGAYMNLAHAATIRGHRFHWMGKKRQMMAADLDVSCSNGCSIFIVRPEVCA